MTTPKEVVVVSPESTSKSRFLASIESKINFWPLSRNFISTERKRPEGGGEIRKSRRLSVTQTI